jgi:NTE family protein
MTNTPPSFSLVLGAGGTVGLAYHAGVLKALAEVGGLEAADAEVIVGTSAGAFVAAYLRSGFTSDDLWQLALGTHPSMSALTDEDLERRRREVFTPAWGTPTELVGRAVGTSFALLRILGLPAVRVPAAVRHRFPAGMFTMAAADDQLAAELPAEFPARPLWLCAYDLVRRERVVLGGAAPSNLTLPRAVLASCAIPGLFRPVRDGRRVLVDGGVASTTNLDLVAKQTVPLVITVAPMAYDPRRAPGRADQLTRRRACVALKHEANVVRAAGHDVWLLRPGRDEIRAHGRNFMRLDDGASEAIARLSYEHAARAIEQRVAARPAA